MSQAVATNDQHMREFQEKVVAKLRADIGEMLPDAALAGLVEKAIQEQFFTKRTTGMDYAGRPTDQKPSWFVEEVAKMAEPQIRAYVQGWLDENKETIKKAVDEFLGEQNLLMITFAAMRSSTFQDINEIASAVVTRMKQPY